VKLIKFNPFLVKMSRLREQLILIQKKNYRKNLAFIRDTLDFNPKIARYESEYHKSLKDYQEITDKQAVIEKIQSSHIVFHGDYHTLKHSQRSVLRLIRHAHEKRDLVVCLEMFHASDQKFIDAFMTGKLTEKKFLNEIDYLVKWPFPWKNFRPIVKYCRAHKIPIKGINSVPVSKKNSLVERDLTSAKIILKTLIQNSNRLVYVMDGDYHISPGHLPGKVKQLANLLDVSYSQTILYQNSEYLYWKLCKKRKEEASVLKINPDSFCLMNTMPANKIQSYLNWLDYSEDAWFPSSEEGDDDFAELSGMSIQNITESLLSLLELKLPKDSYPRREVYYGGDLNFMDVVAGIPELKRSLVSIKNKIKNEEAFLLVYANATGPHYIIYLPNSSINMVAEEAAHFINVVLRGLDGPKLSASAQFYKKVVTECLGFFGSKLINEKRKSQNPTSLKKFIRWVKNSPRGNKSDKSVWVAKLLVDHIQFQKKHRTLGSYERKFREHFKGRYSESFATQLGYFLGNKLFYLVKKNKISMAKIREYFMHPMNQAGEPFDVYIDLVKRIEG